MTKVSVYDFQDYKVYLSAWIRSRPGAGRGEKSRFAQLLRCHSAYISQVLGGEHHLSPEQAVLLNSHLGHREEESSFFLLLVQRARAGNAELRQFFENQIQALLQKRSVLLNRIEFQKVLTEQDQATYYAAWYYAAIHILVVVPRLRTVRAIAEHLDLPILKVQEAVDFLLAIGLLAGEEGSYRVGPSETHLPKGSLMATQHHVNWRLRAIEALNQPLANDFHYSSIGAASKKDIPKIREIFLKAVEETQALVKASGEEEVFCYTLDLFGV